MNFENAVHLAQARAVGELFSSARLRVYDESGYVLLEATLPKDYTYSMERVEFAPPHEAVVTRKGQAASMAVFTADGRTKLGSDLAGDHTGALVRFEDPRLFERMKVSFDDPFIIELSTLRKESQ